MESFVFLAMVYMHIIDDYFLQGILAQLKTKAWWEKNEPDPKYKNDYLTALTMHSLSWAFSIMLPLAIYYGFDISTSPFALFFFANAAIHYTVDDLKANKRIISLRTDQMIHMLQICITFHCLI